MDSATVNEIPLLPEFRDAIRQIKVQKRRPDPKRLRSMLENRHGIDTDEAVDAQLDEAGRRGLLLTGWTNKQECYKDPEIVRSFRKYSVDKDTVTRAVKTAVREIGDHNGSTRNVVEHYIRYSFEIKTPSLDVLVSAALERLVTNGSLVRIGNDRYKCGGVASEKDTVSQDGEGIEEHSENGDNRRVKRAVELHSSPRPEYAKRRETTLRYDNAFVDEDADGYCEDVELVSSAGESEPWKASPPASSGKRSEDSNAAVVSSIGLPKTQRCSLPASNVSAQTALASPFAQPIPRASEALMCVRQRRPPKNLCSVRATDFKQLVPEEGLSSSKAVMKTLALTQNDLSPFSPSQEICSASSTAEDLEALPTIRPTGQAWCLLFQCWCCAFYTANLNEFVLHVGGPDHRAATFQRTVECVVCGRRSKDPEAMLYHLRKYCFHKDGNEPACLLRFTPGWTLFVD